MRYRKKPVVIEAVEWTVGNAAEILDFMGDQVIETSGILLKIKTLEGVMTASPGDWMIKGVEGEFYPCKPEIFHKTYEPI